MHTLETFFFTMVNYKNENIRNCTIKSRKKPLNDKYQIDIWTFDTETI